MADTTLSQDTLNKIEAVIVHAVTSPKEAVKGRIDLDQGGSIQYRSLDELITARDNIKRILDKDSNIDLSASKKSPYRPFSQTIFHAGNL